MTNSILGLPPTVASVILCLCLGAAFAYTVLWPNVPLVADDTERYMRAAVDLSDGRIDHLNERSPGLPIILYLTDSHLSPSRNFWHVQLLFHFSAIWLVCVLLYSLSFSAKAIYAFAVAMLLPPNIENAGYLMSENLAQFLVIGMVFGIIKWLQTENIIYMVGASLAASFAVLTRPTYQALPIFVVIYLVCVFMVMRKRLHVRKLIPSITVFVLGFVLIVGGFSYLNYKRFGHFGVTHLLGYNLSTKTTRFLEKLPDQYGDMREYLIQARDKELIERGSSHSAKQFIWSLGPDEIEKKLNLPPSEAAKYMLNLNWTLIRTAPMSYLSDVAGAMSGYWFPSSSKLANFDSKLMQLFWAFAQFALILIFFLQLVVLFGVSVFDLSRLSTMGQFKRIVQRRKFSLRIPTYVLLIFIIFYTFFISCLVDVGSPRQRSGDGLILFATIVGYGLWFGKLSPTSEMAA